MYGQTTVFAVWADDGCLIVEMVQTEAEVSSESFTVHDSIPTSTVVPTCEQSQGEVLVGREDATPSPFGPAAQTQTVSMIANPHRFSARTGLGSGRGIYQSRTVRQLLALNGERRDDGYEFLARRETNSPIVCKALGGEIVAQREALGMTAKQVYVRADLPASLY